MKISNTEFTIKPSFLLIVAFLMFGFFNAAHPFHSLVQAITTIGFYLLLIGFHEMAHIKAAEKLGVIKGDSEVFFWALGGMAKIPNLKSVTPLEEIKIAAAGPLSNALLIPVGLVGLILSGNNPAILYQPGTSFLGYFFTNFIAFNLVLGVFNLIPALPMDGGRILRGGLALKKSHLEATKISARIAQTLGVCMIVYGLLSFGITVALIGGYVILASAAQIKHAERRDQAQKSGHIIEDLDTIL